VHHYYCPLPTTDCPAITVAGRTWPVPLLAPRQNRIIVPLLVAGAKDYDSLLAVAFAALTRAHPDLRMADLEDSPIPYYELIEALPIIATQTGFAKPKRSAASAKAEAPDWDAIIAQFVNFLPGTTPDYWEDALTVPRIEAMQEEWRLHPPVGVLVAGFLGYKPRPRDTEAIEQLMRLFPGGRLRLN
jgi:hypothetical protein